LAPPSSSGAARPGLLLVVAVLLSALSFIAGYHAGARRHADRVFEEGRRQMFEALDNGIRSGIIEVNDRRLGELTGRVGTNDAAVALGDGPAPEGGTPR
jgi:hypothetical protein